MTATEEITAYSCHLIHTYKGAEIHNGPFPLEGLIGDCPLSDYREYMEVEHGYKLTHLTPPGAANVLAAWDHPTSGRKYAVSFA